MLLALPASMPAQARNLCGHWTGLARDLCEYDSPCSCTRLCLPLMFRSDEGVSSSLTLWGTLLLSVIIFKRSRALMFWPIKRSISGDHHSDAKQTSSKSALSNAEKLSGYHDLAKVSLTATLIAGQATVCHEKLQSELFRPYTLC